MAQRFSGRERQDAEWYPTPGWCTRALIPHLGVGRFCIWEPAAGTGEMAAVLSEAGHEVWASDIRWPDEGQFDQGNERLVRPVFKTMPNGVELHGGRDFLDLDVRPFFDDSNDGPCVVVTNPPYGIQGRLAEKFIRRALEVVKPKMGTVAMLLKIDFDSGKTRRDVFGDCPAWSKKIVLTRRIMWFEPTPDPVTGRVTTSSENHMWAIWSWRHTGPATIAYADGKE